MKTKEFLTILQYLFLFKSLGQKPDIIDIFLKIIAWACVIELLVAFFIIF